MPLLPLQASSSRCCCWWWWWCRYCCCCCCVCCGRCCNYFLLLFLLVVVVVNCKIFHYTVPFPFYLGIYILPLKLGTLDSTEMLLSWEDTDALEVSRFILPEFELADTVTFSATNCYPTAFPSPRAARLMTGGGGGPKAASIHVPKNQETVEPLGIDPILNECVGSGSGSRSCFSSRYLFAVFFTACHLPAVAEIVAT